MDSAELARGAEPGRGSPLVPPNYVSLRHLQELRLKEKEQQEEQRRRREEAAAAPAPARHPETKASPDASCGAKERPFRRQQERQPRREEEATVGRVKEAAGFAAVAAETKASSNTSCGVNGKLFGGLRGQKEWVAVAHRSPPPPRRGEGTAKVKGGAMEDGRGMKGTDAAACNPSRGGGGKAEDKGKEKEKASTGAKGDPGEPAEILMITASSHGCKPEKMEGKGKPSGGQSTSPGTNGRPGEAASASPQPHVRPKSKRKEKKGFGDRSSETDTTSAPAALAGASPPQGVKPEYKGNKKPLVGRRIGAAPSSDSPDRKMSQPPPAAENSSNRRSGDLPGRKRVQSPPATDGSNNPRSGGSHGAMTGEAKSEGLGGKQPVVVVVKGAADWKPQVLRTTEQTKSEGFGEKHPVGEARHAAERKPQVMRSFAWRRPGGGRQNASPRQRGGVWVPKAASPSPSLSGVAGL